MDHHIPYFAGFFDGEGSVNIIRYSPKKGGATYHRLQCCLTQIAPAPIERATALFGGRVYVERSGRRRPVHRWKMSGPPAVDFLRQVQPFLLVKTEVVRLAIEFADVCYQHARPGRKIDEETLQKREWYRHRISELNRGVVIVV